LQTLKKNLLSVITYRCLWKNQRNSVQIEDTQGITINNNSS
jgi:hypothetical protein